MSGTLLVASGLAVVQTFLLGAAGAWLARRGILSKQALNDLSQVVFHLLLPCLLIAKLSSSVNASEVKVLWILPVASVLYIGVGFLLGFAVRAITRPAADVRHVVVASVAFSNSGYLPLNLVAAIAVVAPLFAANPADAANRGVAYVSVFLLGFTFLLWTLGFTYVSGEPLSAVRWRKVLTPPVIGLGIGAFIGVIPPLHSTFVGPHAPLHVVHAAMESLGAAAVPCAMLVLGGNLAKGPVPGAIRLRSLIGVGIGRLLLMPLVGIGFVLVLSRLGWLPDNPMLKLVLMLSTASPTSTNLSVITQIHGQGEQAMSNILFWVNLTSVVTLTIYLSIFLWLVGGVL